LFVTISDTVSNLIGIKILPGLRHLLLFFSFYLCNILSGSLIKISKKQLIYITVFLLLTSLSFFRPYTDFIRYSYGMFLTLLFIPIYIIAKSIKISTLNFIFLIKLILIFIIIVAIYAVFSALIQGINLRFVTTLFREAGAFAAIMNIGIIFSLFLYLKDGSKWFLLLALFLTICIISTVLKKSILASFLIWFLFILFNKNTRNKVLFNVGIFSTIIMGLLFNFNSIIQNMETNSEYIDDVGIDEHVRVAMYIASYKIAIDNFPIGSGFGTFASVPSIYNGYNFIYDKYGISSIPSNSYSAVKDENHTILDTYWPHIIGETGFFGFILFLLIYMYPIIYFNKYFKKKLDYKNRLLYAFIIYSCILTTILQGFFLYIPELPTFIFINSGFIGILFNQINFNIAKT
jgi:hypothetical protein